MHFFGISPAGLALLTKGDLRCLMDHMRKIRARQRLEFIFDMGAMISYEKDSDSKAYILSLVNQAYCDPEDQVLRAEVIESITRRSSHGD
jgi:hypothetical protein